MLAPFARFLAAFAFLFTAWGAAPALADTAAEQFVAQRGNAALASLGAPGQTAASRQAQFRALFLQLADLQQISSFVLGPNAARKLRSDPALNAQWQAAFIDYATAVYEDQLDQFRGSELKVTGSVDRVPGRDVIVRSTIARSGSKPAMVEWRVLKRGDEWKAVDASLVIQDSRIWLAQRQKQDFEPVLGANANIPALITLIRQQTATMRARIMARSSTR